MSAIPFESALRGSRIYSLLCSELKTAPGHAYLVTCADDELTDAFFTLVAATVFCQRGDACMECAECRKALHGNNPDVIHIYPDKGKINVRAVEEMLDSVYLRSLSGKKLYFIHRADLMNPNAQNRLLKTLEEPPQNITFFVSTANESGVLDTVKSRTRKLNMDAFERDVVYNILRELGYDEQRCEIAAACSEGMPGVAKQIAASDEYRQCYSDALDMLGGLKRSGDILAMSAIVTRQKDMDKFLDILSIIIRDMMMFKQPGGRVLNAHISDSIADLSKEYSAHALADIIGIINEERKKLKLNVNATAVADDLLFGMLEVRHKWQQ